MTPVFLTSQWKNVLAFTNIVKESGKNSFGYIRYQTVIRHPGGNVYQAV